MTYGLLAQQAERHPVKVRVAGSIPAGTAIWSPRLKERTSGFHPGNDGFKSHGDHHTAL